MKYDINVTPAAGNPDPAGTQYAATAALKDRFPYSVVTQAKTGTLSVSIPAAPKPPPKALFQDAFERPDGLVTNEYAYWNPQDGASVQSPDWEMTSGSLFIRNKAAWTGIPDVISNPTPDSSQGTNSANFRATTRRKDLGNVAISFRLNMAGFISTQQTPAVAWDGVHVFLRYQSEYQLYYASVNRRDNHVVIKKKVPGGSSNGGTYYEIGSYHPFTFPFGVWQNVKVTIQTKPDQTVLITMQVVAGSQTMTWQAVDNGIGGAPILAAGGTGIRGDNCNFQFDDFRVDTL